MSERLTRADIERIRDLAQSSKTGRASEGAMALTIRDLTDTALALMAERDAMAEVLRDAIEVFAPLLADADLDAGNNPAWIAIEHLRVLVAASTGGIRSPAPPWSNAHVPPQRIALDAMKEKS